MLKGWIKVIDVEPGGDRQAEIITHQGFEPTSTQKRDWLWRPAMNEQAPAPGESRGERLILKGWMKVR